MKFEVTGRIGTPAKSDTDVPIIIRICSPIIKVRVSGTGLQLELGLVSWLDVMLGLRARAGVLTWTVHRLH